MYLFRELNARNERDLTPGAVEYNPTFEIHGSSRVVSCKLTK